MNSPEIDSMFVQRTLREAFKEYLVAEVDEFIHFSDMDVFELAEILVNFPMVFKPLACLCNIAGRALERDLGIKNLDTYGGSLNEDQAKVVAGYIKPFLPDRVSLTALGHVDKVAFIDKEVRKLKGQWEKQIVEALNRFGAGRQTKFKKRHFKVEGEEFELDAASPLTGDIRLGVDIKRVEARRDIHKRCDEIVNKAAKLRGALPAAKFAAVIYFPFPEDHSNVRDRLRSQFIDGVFFASQTQGSIESAARLLLSTLLEGMK